MTLNSVPANGRQDILGNQKTRYWTGNTLTGERVSLAPAADGATADYPMAQRYGHQIQDTDGASIAPAGVTGVASWKLGNRDTFVTLSTAGVQLLYTPVNTFGSTGTLSAPVVFARANEVTRVQLDNRCRNRPPPYGDGQVVAQLAIVQGGNVVLLSQQNCADLAPQLLAIGAT